MGCGKSTAKIAAEPTPVRADTEPTKVKTMEEPTVQHVRDTPTPSAPEQKEVATEETEVVVPSGDSPSHSLPSPHCTRMSYVEALVFEDLKDNSGSDEPVLVKLQRYVNALSCSPPQISLDERGMGENMSYADALVLEDLKSNSGCVFGLFAWVVEA